MMKHLQIGVWHHKKRQIRNLMQICLLRLKTGGEDIRHNTRRYDELWVLADGLKWGWRKSVYLAKFFWVKNCGWCDLTLGVKILGRLWLIG